MKFGRESRIEVNAAAAAAAAVKREEKGLKIRVIFCFMCWP